MILWLKTFFKCQNLSNLLPLHCSIFDVRYWIVVPMVTIYYLWIFSKSLRLQIITSNDKVLDKDFF